MSEHTMDWRLDVIRPPWQVTMQRDKDGCTSYFISQHTHTSIAVIPDGYWPEGYEPPTDDDGYAQPDEHIDCMEHRVNTARLIAAAPDLLAACEALVSRARQPHEGAFDWFERLAAMFTSETGLIPPGKDCPPQAADYKATTEQWHEWIRAPYAVGKAAIARAKGETP
jgi:hypothetical protein